MNEKQPDKSQDAVAEALRQKARELIDERLMRKRRTPAVTRRGNLRICLHERRMRHVVHDPVKGLIPWFTVPPWWNWQTQRSLKPPSGQDLWVRIPPGAHPFQQAKLARLESFTREKARGISALTDYLCDGIKMN